MVRPLFKDIVAGMQAWDSEMNDNLAILRDGPFPPFDYGGDESSLETDFPAAENEHCFVNLEHSTDGWIVAWSNGTAWVRVSTEPL